MRDERFWSRVDRSGECWLWTGAVNNKGYGRLNRRGHFSLAHRFAWAEANGPIADGLVICHHCDTPACVRLDHLFAGTRADNNADARAKGRMHAPHPRWERIPRGANHHWARYTEEQVREVRRLAALGIRQAVIARRLGINDRTVSRIVLRHIWTEVK